MLWTRHQLKDVQMENLMGTVLKFPLEQVSRTSSNLASDHQAEILVYEGIRYRRGKTVSGSKPVKDAVVPK